MSNLEEKPVTDFHIAQLDRNGKKIAARVVENQWKLLNTDMAPEEIIALHKEQIDTINAAQWLSNIKGQLRPPVIIPPTNGHNGMKLVN